MKRKEKSGHEKMHGSKRKSLREAASAAGQKSLSKFLKKNSDVSAMEKQVQPIQQPLLSENKSNITAGYNKNDITVDSQSSQIISIETQTSSWYKGKKLDIDWLVSSEDWLEITRAIKDNVRVEFMLIRTN